VAHANFKKFIIYSVFLGILILPMVGFPGTRFNTSRALTVWGVVVGILALWLISGTVRRSGSYQRAAVALVPIRDRIFAPIIKLPPRYFIGVLLIAVAVYPQVANNYMVDVGITCLIYIVLGLGLNIVVVLGMSKPAVYYPAVAEGGLRWVTYSLKSLHALYYLILVIAVLTVVGVNRLDNSRIGRAWVAIREDEVAAELSGVPTTRLKLLAYAIGAAFASVAGAFFAAKLSYTNPNFFIFMESCIVLCIVVLGGVGSIPGIILAGIALIAVPEVFRELQDYRMFAFGLAMAVMMVLRPEGLIPASRSKRQVREYDHKVSND